MAGTPPAGPSPGQPTGRDPAGNLLTATDAQAGSITRAYDPLHRLVGETTPQGSVLYAYDAASRRTQMQPSGLPPVTYAYL